MLAQFVRYNIVGIANTLVGFGLILLLMLAGISPLLSNMFGYAVGAVLSYYLNSKYTFNGNQRGLKQGLKFFTVLLFAYGLNVIVLQALLAEINPYLAQFCAAIVYTASSFMMMKFFVFIH